MRSFPRIQTGIPVLIIVASFILVLTPAGLAQPQVVVLDPLSIHVVAGSTARVGILITVPTTLPTILRPTQVQFDFTYDPNMLMPVGAFIGPAGGSKRVTLQMPSPGVGRVVVLGNSDRIATGILVFLDFGTEPGLLPKLTSVGIVSSSASNDLGQSFSTIGRSALVIINGGCEVHLWELFFAQVASGLQAVDFGGYETYLIITNLAGTPTRVFIEFFQENGQPFHTTIEGDLDNSFMFQLAPHATMVIETNNIGKPIQKGWARVHATGPVGGNAIYSYINPAGRVGSQTAILPSEPTSVFALTFDTRTAKIIGLAVANHNATQVIFDLELRHLTGVVRSRKTMVLPPFAKFALVLEEIFPDVDLRNFVGRIVGNANGQPVVATSLRFSGDLSIFTSQQIIPMTF